MTRRIALALTILAVASLAVAKQSSAGWGIKLPKAPRLKVPTPPRNVMPPRPQIPRFQPRPQLVSTDSIRSDIAAAADSPPAVRRLQPRAVPAGNDGLDAQAW